MQQEHKELLNKLFKEFSKNGLIAKQNYLTCDECAIYQMGRYLKKYPNKKGFVFYTHKDYLNFELNKGLHLGYGGQWTGKKHNQNSDKKDLQIGILISKILLRLKCNIEWSGTTDEKIFLRLEISK